MFRITSKFALFFVFLFLGCENFLEHDVLISNDSSVSVRFRLERYDDTVYTLNSGKKITLKIYNNPTLIFEGNPRVDYTSTSSVSIFDIKSYDCIIINKTLFDVKIKELNFKLGEEQDDGGVTIPKAYGIVDDTDTVNIVFPKVSKKLYTLSPLFEIVDTNHICNLKVTESKYDSDGVEKIKFQVVIDY